MNKKVVYVGKDLEAMSFAVNYHKWILEEFRPFLGKKLVEVGAGTGSFSAMLLAEKPENLALVEPSEMFGALEQNISQLESKTVVNYYNAIFSEAAGNLEQQPDTIIYVNVLEHIEDDRGELKKVYETLDAGGHCLIFVPAFMSLYGAFDEKVGHFRRYTKTGLEEKAKAAGFKVVKSKYFDFAGIFPWYIKYKLLKLDSLKSGAVTAYDKFAVPVAKQFERFLTFPAGKNILTVLQK
ncbi:MAG TPA: class I SAM-dependent methyltransferase [Pyrinomonadaceae bacterium]|jgi:2-polyprenyl-3-methyl-5-hydroxy-6-metoxy-1,4-benzoquinol methylase